MNIMQEISRSLDFRGRTFPCRGSLARRRLAAPAWLKALCVYSITIIIIVIIIIIIIIVIIIIIIIIIIMQVIVYYDYTYHYYYYY